MPLAGVDATVRRTLCLDVDALVRARDEGTKAVHAILKAHGVTALGVRAKIAQVVGAFPCASGSMSTAFNNVMGKMMVGDQVDCERLCSDLRRVKLQHTSALNSDG